VLGKSPKLGQKWMRLAQPNELFPNHISNPQASHPIPLEIVTNFKYRVKLAASNIDYNIS
jgi:hypothetical protein